MPLYEFVCDSCGQKNNRFQALCDVIPIGEKIRIICDVCLTDTPATRILSKPSIGLSADRVLANWASQDIKIKRAKRKMEQERASGYRRPMSEDPEGYTLDDIDKGRVPD